MLPTRTVQAESVFEAYAAQHARYGRGRFNKSVALTALRCGAGFAGALAAGEGIRRVERDPLPSETCRFCGGRRGASRSCEGCGAS